MRRRRNNEIKELIKVSGAFSTPCVPQSSGATLASCVVETEEVDGEKEEKPALVVPGGRSI